MKTIHEYRLELGRSTVGDRHTLQMPAGAKVLHVHSQNDDVSPYLWAFVDTDQAFETRAFAVYGTGRDLGTSNPNNYIGSAHCGPFVWHIFEVY